MTLTAPSLPAHVVEKIRQIASRHGVRDVRLVGSFARGEGGPGSDLDLLIRLDAGRGFRDLMDFCDELEAAVAKRVDAVTEDGLSPYLRERVLAEAVPL
jgi:hypothetical protein